MWGNSKSNIKADAYAKGQREDLAKTRWGLQVLADVRWVDLTELKNNTAQGEAPQKGSRNLAGSAALQQRHGQDRTCIRARLFSLVTVVFTCLDTMLAEMCRQRSGKWARRKPERWLICSMVDRLILPIEKSGLCPERSSLKHLECSAWLPVSLWAYQLVYANNVTFANNAGALGHPYQLNFRRGWKLRTCKWSTMWPSFSTNSRHHSLGELPWGNTLCVLSQINTGMTPLGKDNWRLWNSPRLCPRHPFPWLILIYHFCCDKH